MRADKGRQESPSEAIIDSQSVKSATMVHEDVGFDGAKLIQGRKRHTVVDTLGLVLRVVVTAASVPECAGGKQVLQKVHQVGEAVSRWRPHLAPAQAAQSWPSANRAGLVNRIAEEYGLSEDQVDEALRFYVFHKAEIETAIASELGFESAHV